MFPWNEDSAGEREGEMWQETDWDRERKKTEKDSIRLRTGRMCNRHTETEILIRVRAVMFKLSDNIPLHVFTGLLFVDK